jgi:DNA-binding XRE family transcriptional regulator
MPVPKFAEAQVDLTRTRSPFYLGFPKLFQVLSNKTAAFQRESKNCTCVENFLFENYLLKKRANECRFSVNIFSFTEVERNMDLSKFLKEKRLEAGLSQGAVAKKLGYTSPQFVSNWERGLSQPPVATLRKIAQIYNISANDMFDVMLKATLDQVTAELTEKFYKQSKTR